MLISLLITLKCRKNTTNLIELLLYEITGKRNENEF